MHSPLQLATKYFKYQLNAYNSRGHGMHSPFVYEMIRNVFIDRHHYAAYSIPELYRKKLTTDQRVVEVEDFGAGSRDGNHKQRRICDIAKSSVKPYRYSQLIYRIAAYYKYQYILELGTSLGVTSSYLAQVPGLKEFITMEGADSIANLAEQHFKEQGFDKVKLLRGNFDKTMASANGGEAKTLLENVVASFPRIDLAFVDGNHRKEPTLRYFENILPKTHNNSCIIFDDIHWSRDMEEAWDLIRQHQGVKLSIDLFSLGLVFFRNEFREKQHFTIRF